MTPFGRSLTVGIALVALAPVADAATRTRHHHRAHVARAPAVSPYAGYYGYSPYGAYAPAPFYGSSDAAIIAAATERARHEPGVTLELDPSIKLTATGGPSGGIPDRSGGP